MDVSYSNYSISLDLAPYNINKNTTAIGFRNSYSTSYTGNAEGEEYLTLFMPYEKQMLQILFLSIDDYNVDIESLKTDGTRDRFGHHNKSTVHVLKTKTKESYDYLVKTVQYKYEGKEIKKSTLNTYYIWSKEKKQYVPKK